ncbi:MAG: ferritin-like domain-containing protein [Candidatus Acidiferrales bacterium]
MENSNGVPGFLEKYLKNGGEPTSGVGRRKFLKTTGMGIAGASLLGGVATSLLSSVPALASTPGGTITLSANDIAVLNFALNLEYLEAEFYTVATTGKTISQIGIGVSGVGKSGPTLGGQKINFGNNQDFVGTTAQQIAQDEQEHVFLLRTLLGSNAVAKPEINLDALGHVATISEFLAEARAFEDVGVSAYGGAAPLIQSKSVLATAARIALTEGEHTGNLRLLVALFNVRTMPVDSQDILPPPSGTELLSNTEGLTIVRTPSEVLAILYANKTQGTKSGGFFPQGVNGPINTVS